MARCQDRLVLVPKRSALWMEAAAVNCALGKTSINIACYSSAVILFVSGRRNVPKWPDSIPIV